MAEPGDQLSVDTLHGSTVGDSERMHFSRVVAPVLTILWHPDVRRIGERSRLDDPGGEGRVRLSRLHPLFGAPAGPDTSPLALPNVSRHPHHLEIQGDGGVVLTTSPDASKLTIDGAPAAETTRFPAELLRVGVVLELSRRIVLLLHAIPPVATEQPDLGLVGQSPALVEVRSQILRVAPHDVPVLIRGESGTGKELVAAAVHQSSVRANKPFVAANMAAIVPSTAASALFGHVRGAFTGADKESSGMFGQADGGTLFMDEIGETPDAIQPALLRALQNGEVQPVGASMPATRDVRILAATDASLEEAVRSGSFRLPLLQRLAGYEVNVPPLRERRDDIGLLLVTFLRERLAAMGAHTRLAAPDGGARPWMTTDLVVRAALAPWVGNVRELRNLAQRLAIDFGAANTIPSGPALDALLPPPVGAEVGTVQEGSPRRPTGGPRKLIRDIDEDAVIAALERNGYRPGPAATELGVSRTSLYALIEASDRIRKAGELSAEEIRAELDATSGDQAAAAARLKVSQRGLRLRMKQLGLV